MAAEDDKQLEDIRDIIRYHVPEYDLKMKSESWLQRLIGKIMGMVGNKTYMTSFWTTIGYTTYRPSNPGWGEWTVICHEGMHAIQARHMGSIVMGMLYLIPLTLIAPIALLGFWHWWFLIIAAACALPLPAYFRMKMEVEAYQISMAVTYWMTGNVPQSNIEYIKKNFTGWNYYKMWPFKSSIDKKLLKKYEEIKNGEILKDLYPRQIYEYLLKEGLVYNGK